MNITIISSWEKKKYFFSKDHCQNHGLEKDYIPTTYSLPQTSVMMGRIENIPDLVLIHYPNFKEIRNPDPNMQP